MFSSYAGILLINLSWYEPPLGTWRSSDLSQAPSHDKEHDAQDAISLRKDSLREDTLVFSNQDAVNWTQTSHELKVRERFAACIAGDIAQVDYIDIRERELCKWETYRFNAEKAYTKPSKAKMYSHPRSVSS